MATPAPAAESTQDKTSKTSTSMVIVELDEPQSPMAVKRLRKGKGRLFNNVDQIVKDLIEDGTVKANAQPVVIIVQTMPAPPWAFDDDDD
jgi:hypothetical protein